MSAAAVEQALRALGIDARVTADGGLAVLHVAAGDRTLEDAASRRAALEVAAAHGFRSLALEVGD